MFAFVIWDAPRRRLFCARDRLGIKPFYYYWDGRLFAFASEIKALLEHPAISPALAEELLPEVLAFGYTSGDRTLFQNIHKLMPGYRLMLETAGGNAELAIDRYWDVPPGAGQRGIQHGSAPSGMDQRSSAATGTIRRNAPDERRAARSILERRRGFQRHCGSGAALSETAGEDFRRGLR